MENTEQPLLGLEINSPVKNALTDSAGWAKFISVALMICFTVIAVLCITLIFFKEELWERLSLADSYIGIQWIYPLLVFALLGIASYVYCYFKLYKYSVQVKLALIASDQLLFESSARQLKMYMLFSAVLAILGLAINIATTVALFIN